MSLDRQREDKLEPQSRESFEAPVRQFEDRVLGVALSLVQDQERAERIVEQAFARVLTVRGHDADLEPRLAMATHKLARSRARGPAIRTLPQTDVRVSRDLHLRILDAVEDRQYTSQPVRSRLIALGAAILVVAVAGVVQVQRTRSQALAAAAPTISDLSPAGGARDVPIQGEFRVHFTSRPFGTPTISHVPTDGRQQVASWDGTTLVVDYTGLRYNARYQLVVHADYQSRLHETGHFEQRWTFQSEGPSQFLATTPADGAALIPRSGQLSIQFSKRPPVDPVVTIDPPDATTHPGSWSAATWVVEYSGLQPLHRYEARFSVRPRDSAGRIERAWAFTVEPGSPPVGTAVVWYSAANPWQPAPNGAFQPVRFNALDWSGALVGTLYQGGGVRQAPDGSRIVTQDGQFYDQAGALQSGGPQPWGITWADDSRHVCTLRDASGTAQNIQAGQQEWLFTETIGGARRRVASAGAPTAESGPSIIACSVLGDRAVIGDQVMGGYLAVRVLELSSGRVLYRHSYGDQSANVTSSHDGRYLAELTTSYGSQGAAPSSTTLIRRTSDGVIVARLPGQTVAAFSWDGSRVVTTPTFGGPGAEIRLVDWQRGTVLWRLSGLASDKTGPTYVIARPGGTDLMVAVASGDSADLWLVHADGTASRIVSAPVYPAFNGGS